MPRVAVAVLVGILGIVLYVMAVVALADHVLGWHWLVQFAYFALAGVVWTVPARRLILWAAAAPKPR